MGQPGASGYHAGAADLAKGWRRREWSACRV